MINKLTEKISALQAGKEYTAAYMVGEQLKDICKNSPALVEIVLQDLELPEMSLEAAEKKIREHADELHKKIKGRSVCVPPDEAEKIIRSFYGLPETSDEAKTESGFIDLDSFLR